VVVFVVVRVAAAAGIFLRSNINPLNFMVLMDAQNTGIVFFSLLQVKN